MEKTVTIKNVQATEAELRAALASLEKPDRVIDKKGPQNISLCAGLEVIKEGRNENPILVFVGLSGSTSHPGFAYVTKGDIGRIISKLKMIQEEMS